MEPGPRFLHNNARSNIFERLVQSAKPLRHFFDDRTAPLVNHRRFKVLVAKRGFKYSFASAFTSSAMKASSSDVHCWRSRSRLLFPLTERGEFEGAWRDRNEQRHFSKHVNVPVGECSSSPDILPASIIPPSRFKNNTSSYKEDGTFVYGVCNSVPGRDC
jgi:hypothetical protein